MRLRAVGVQKGFLFRYCIRVRTDEGKRLLRKRAEYVERGFDHVLDCGGAGRMTLRGRENI